MPVCRLVPQYELPLPKTYITKHLNSQDIAPQAGWTCSGKRTTVHRKLYRRTLKKARAYIVCSKALAKSRKADRLKPT